MAIDPQAGFALNPNQRMAERLADLERRLARAERSTGLRTGFVYAIGGTTAPAGTLLCNGADYARADYPALFAAIGTTHGAANASLFRVPNLAGRSPMGAGAGAGLTARAAGVLLGAETHALTVGEMPHHRHGIVGAAWSTNLPPGSTQAVTLAPGAARNWALVDLTPGDPNDTPIYGAGGSAAHPNVHPSTVLAFVIAT